MHFAQWIKLGRTITEMVPHRNASMQAVSSSPMTNRALGPQRARSGQKKAAIKLRVMTSTGRRLGHGIGNMRGTPPWE
jgi:hypothetical protein